MAQTFEVALKLTGREDVSRSAVKAERSLSRLGDRGSRALRRIGTVGAGVRRSLQAVGRAIFSLRGLVAGLLGALAARAAISSIISAANEQIEAEARLTQALGGSTEALKKQASELQKLTGIGDEVIISMMALLGTFKLSKESVTALTPGILDMATAMKIDLNAASLLIGKALAGQTGALSRYGIVLTETQRDILQTGTEMQKVAVISGLLTKRFGGTAEALGETFRGRLNLLTGSFGDLQEEIGFQLIPTLKPLIALAIEYVVQLQNWIKTHNVAVPVLRGMISVLGFLVQAINIVAKAWLFLRASIAAVAELYLKANSLILKGLITLSRAANALGLVSDETVRKLMVMRMESLQMGLEFTNQIVEIKGQWDAWDKKIAVVKKALGEFRAAIVPQMAEVGDAARRASDALAGIGATEPSIDAATRAIAEQAIQAKLLNPTLDDLGRITRIAADAQDVLASSIDRTTASLVQNAQAARSSAQALAALGGGPIAQLLALLKLPPSDPRRIAAGGGFAIMDLLRKLGFKGGITLAHGAVVSRPTLAMVGEAGRELIVPFARSQRSPQVQAEFERLAAEEGGGGDIVVPVQINLDSRVLARAVFRQKRRGVK